MIKNERQYQITKAKLLQFKESLIGLNSSSIDELTASLYRGALESQIEELSCDIKEYDYLRSQEVSSIQAEFEELPEMLIKARIYNGWSQADLASKLGVKEQQIQRYEACNYSTATFTRMVSVANAIGLHLCDIKANFPAKQLVVEGFDPSQLKAAVERLRLNRSLFNL